jgi:hypothetical protein
MSKLEFYARPLVAFDPKNKDHRKWYHEFVEKSSWGYCPVRFICPNDTGLDLTIMIRNQLVDYYVQKEFAQTVKKKVDSKPKRVYNKRKLK